MPIDEIVDVVAVWHWLVSASRAVYVTRIMSLANVVRGATVWIGIADL